MLRLYTRLFTESYSAPKRPPWMIATASEWGWAGPADAVPPALAAADDQPPQGSSPKKADLHSRPLLPEAWVAAPSQWACVGTSGHAAPPYRQTKPQLPPSASSLPAAGDRKRPCWSGAYACRTQWGPV